MPDLPEPRDRNQGGIALEPQICRNCGENPQDEYPYCFGCWEDGADGGDLFCRVHGCRYEWYDIMTDCGTEWDQQCIFCRRESDEDNVRMAEYYSKLSTQFGASPMRILLNATYL